MAAIIVNAARVVPGNGHGNCQISVFVDLIRELFPEFLEQTQARFDLVKLLVEGRIEVFPDFGPFL